MNGIEHKHDSLYRDYQVKGHPSLLSCTSFIWNEALFGSLEDDAFVGRESLSFYKSKEQQINRSM